MSRPPPTALLIIDMINAFDYAGARELLHQTRKIVKPISELKSRARRARRPVIYCNDNFGEWRSDFKAVVAACTGEHKPARELILSIAPEADDYFILKPRHSAFYETALESLLEDLKVERLVLCGIAGDGCIHATATDAHMRKYEVAVVRDATASQTAARNRTALSHLENAKYASLCAASRTRL
jgi:nicotinamidase-related amidase